MCPNRHAAGMTRRKSRAAQRHKEESSDYRYFPDPDLVPVRVSREEVERVRAELGELPAALAQRDCEQTYQLEAYDADVLVNQGRALVDYFETVAQASGDPKRASNWIQQDVLRTLNERAIALDAFPVSATSLAELLKLVQDGDLDTFPSQRRVPTDGRIGGVGGADPGVSGDREGREG